VTRYEERLTDDGSVVIFLFHGVIKKQVCRVRNYTRKHIPVDEFDGIIGSLCARGTPVSMDDVLAHCETGQPFPKGAFAVTFDDGFENNLSVARPVLQQYGVPATVYVTSRFIEQNGMSWIDRIEIAFELAEVGDLSLPWSSGTCSFSDASSKIAILDEIRRMVKSDRHLDVDAFVSSVFRQLGVDEIHSSNDPLDLKMTWPEVREWCAPGYTIGGHSHTHAILSFLSPDALAAELDTSLELMRVGAGITSPHYSYPEGQSHCFSPAVIDSLKLRGIRCCPTAIDGVNTPDTDPFLLRRVMVA
jgi:peptidoglycan/xylan/chitin deacetylase (PgdA/CDA1 family)